ncbi:MAG TPA: FkbM family methyltransferase [Gaiellaceae bacterium]|nr:FkbM family methyltransferase [Gaiellaceae bacterium]
MTSARIRIRDAVASALRALPRFRGKGRLGVALERLLTDYSADEECLPTFVGRESMIVRVDLRSSAERYAFWTGEYDRNVPRLLDVLDPTASVLDVGASVGLFTVPLARGLRERGGCVYAFEPFPSNYARLVEAISLNGLDETVTAVQLALGERSGTIRLGIVEALEGATTGNAAAIRDDVEGVRTAVVRCEPLDAIAGQLGVGACGLIKVDIEGGELAFFRGARDFVHEHRPLVYCELNYAWMSVFGWRFRDLLDLVAPWGYDVYRARGSRFVAARVPARQTEDVLLVPRGTRVERRARRHLGLIA